MEFAHESVVWTDYTLPAGWLFFGIPQVHFDEEKYDDPLTFNPWRWQVTLINQEYYNTNIKN